MKISIKKADKEWAQKIKARDHWTCQRCGKSYPQKSQGLHAAHIFSRRYKATRHDLENGLALCFGCHSWCHRNPLDSIEFFRDYVGADKFEELRLKAKRLQIQKWD